ncbi:hypothetical protein A9Q84_12845 [Halobacteriovorax marinus]|uniref:Uncharacterized protein n=1 Tax=Halobacteriovorax marinus TaxID=97084 RepID=A0A1Y5F8D7_9BACT|nr:hypothetical protein A9Q84_12845 [Halobacteriovorax marinus]
MNSYIKKYKLKDIVEESGRISWVSPSNIALIKYWGKHGNQLPSNPSISFTLNDSKTTMDFSWSKKSTVDDSIVLDFYFENKKNEPFAQKILTFLERNIELFPFFKTLSLEIESTNSFPHSAGIASSASSMSALALGLCTVENEAYDLGMSESEINDKASFVARLASGSACRSVYGKVVSWGHSEHELINSTNETSSIVLELDEIFSTYRDSILIVDSAVKPVSSRAGHALMNNHPFKDVRFKNAKEQMMKLVDSMIKGDLESFCKIVETEALELHGLMMNSDPSFILMKPATLSIIERIRSFRDSSKLPICFTLDAGPNVHLLYPDNIKEEVMSFIKSDLLPFTQNDLVIHDFVGSGPERYL